MEQYALDYESKLPFMFELIGSQSQTPPGEYGMTDLQAEFWRVVWEKKDGINSDPKHIRNSTVVRQFYLEVEVWRTFWDEKSFPGTYPIATQPQPTTTSQTVCGFEVWPSVLPFPAEPSVAARTPTSQSFTSQRTIQPAPRAVSSATQHPNIPKGVPQNFAPNTVPLNTTSQNPLQSGPFIQQPQFNFEVQPVVPKLHFTPSLRDEARKVLSTKKGSQYVPRHGWDNATGLPIYTILCFSGNGFHAFCGERQEYFNAVRQAFPKFCIMFQKVQRGFMIIWIEARSVEQTVALGTDAELWKEFKECWAFLKSWASQPGDSVNVVMYMKNYAGDAEAEAEADSLLLPPYPASLL